MNVFGTKKTYAEQLINIKSVFTTALNQSKELVSKIKEDIAAKNEEIKNLQTDVAILNDNLADTNQFIDNLSKLV